MSVSDLWFFQLAACGLFSPLVLAGDVGDMMKANQEPIVISHQSVPPSQAPTRPPTLAAVSYRDDMEAVNIDAGGIAEWLTARFGAADLQSMQTGDLVVEPHFCGCYDKPNSHFPYAMVVIKTPRADLIARAEHAETCVTFVPLAVRRGNEYCDVHVEGTCFGSFRDPCDFTDFRYGPYLSGFFPSCKSEEIQPTYTPVGM